MKYLVCFFTVAFVSCAPETPAKPVSSMPLQPIPTISADALKEKLSSADSTNLVLLDVREPDEHAARHIPNSMLIPLGSLAQRVGELDGLKDKEIVVYCRSGRRSEKACEFLLKQNFKVKNLDGGILAW